MKYLLTKINGIKKKYSSIYFDEILESNRIFLILLIKFKKNI